MALVPQPLAGVIVPEAYPALMLPPGRLTEEFQPSRIQFMQLL